MIEIKAPGMLEALHPRPWVFLAGSIEQDKAKPWQRYVALELLPFTGTILNPRRDHWDPTWVQSPDNPDFREQVTWELNGQENSDHILMYFDPETKSPITLLELGLFARRGEKGGLTVCCSEDFWRYGNIAMTCLHYEIPLYDDLDTMLDELGFLHT